MVFLRVQSTRRSDRFWHLAKICRVWGQGPQTQSPGGEPPVLKKKGETTMDIIAAISTAPAVAAIGVLRLSGAGAFAVADTRPSVAAV